MSSNPETYRKQAETAMKNFGDACNALTSLAASYKMHESHVAHMQAQVNKRCKDLVKQLGVEHSDVEASLPDITANGKS